MYILFIVLIFLALTIFISLAFSIYRLTKAYREKSDKKLIMKRWRSILLHLVIFPAVINSISKETSTVINSFSKGTSTLDNSFELGFEIGRFVGSAIVDVLIFYGGSLIAIYIVSWIICKLLNKEILSGVLGFIIIITFLPLNLGTGVLVYRTMLEQSTKQNAENTNLDKVVLYAEQNKSKFEDTISIYYGLNSLEDFYDFPEMNLFLSGKIQSADEFISVKKVFVKKIKKLKEINTKWSKQHRELIANDSILKNLLDDFLAECDDWKKISQASKAQVFKGFKSSFQKKLMKSSSLIKEYAISSPWELRLVFFEKALSALDIQESFLKINDEKIIQNLEKQYDIAINAVNDHVEKENEFLIKLQTASTDARQ